MARSSGFKINRNLRTFLEDFEPLAVIAPQDVFEIRAIVGKYQKLNDIHNDFNEMDAEDQAENQAETQIQAEPDVQSE